MEKSQMMDRLRQLCEVIERENGGLDEDQVCLLIDVCFALDLEPTDTYNVMGEPFLILYDRSLEVCDVQTEVYVEISSRQHVELQESLQSERRQKEYLLAELEAAEAQLLANTETIRQLNATVSELIDPLAA